VELNINVGERDRNKDVFNRFLSQKQAIEEEFGEQLSWEPLEKSCRIAVYRPGSIDDDDTRLGNLMSVNGHLKMHIFGHEKCTGS